LRGALVTASHAFKAGAVVCVHAEAMKEAWCLAVSNAEASTAMQVNLYAKRRTVEPNFRDTKDLRFGMGLAVTRIGEPTRRDRLLLIDAFAMLLLTMVGAARESLGMDRLLKSNTSKTRTHSLFRQGCMLYDSSQPCQITDYPRSCPGSLRPYQTAGRSAECSRSCEMRG
jgi:hypothetical protein